MIDTHASMTEEDLAEWTREHGTPPHIKLSVRGTIDGHDIRFSCEVSEAIRDRAERWVKHQARVNHIKPDITEQTVYEPGKEWK